MTYIDTSILVEKGFIDSFKKELNEKYKKITGKFIYSLDYLDNKKNIISVREMSGRLNLETLIEVLIKNYNNFHLNYLLVNTSIIFIHDKNDFEFNYRSLINEIKNKVGFNRNNIKPEFMYLTNGLKSKVFKDNNIEMIFINRNIYSHYINRYK